MRRLILWTATTLLTGSLCISGPQAQDADDEFFPPGPGSGSVGAVDDLPADDDDLEDWWPAMVPDSPYEGPLGQVDNREPHDACENCFTIPDVFGYTIWESVQVEEDSEHLIQRHIPNPAPLVDGEARETADADGEPIWYIGQQGYSGPQDTAPLGTTGFSMIEVKRVRFRHEPQLMALSGVHGVGIVADGIGVFLTPGSPTAQIPAHLEGVPVRIFFEDLPVFQGHQSTKFRPVPVAAGIYAADRYTFEPVGGGTLGPHITRNTGTCCQVWSLTAAHVVREDPSDPVPAPGTVPIYQPTVGSGKFFGYVAHLFRLQPCGTASACIRPNAPTNYMTVNPDIAAIDGDPYSRTQSKPYNTPSGTDPIRRLMNTGSSYINGPSGQIRVATPGHTLKVWGAYGGPRVGQVKQTERIIVPRLGNQRYRMCCLSSMSVSTQDGDSGAAVTYGGTGKRHIAGVHIAGDAVNHRAWFIAADDIKEAFRGASKPFAHYWGTKSGYRDPSTKTCDPPGC